MIAVTKADTLQRSYYISPLEIYILTVSPKGTPPL